jgi:protein O-GlcNAc transferase
MKVISFSLWGTDPIYTVGAVNNAKLAQKIYPDWECWFYVGKSCPPEITQQLKEQPNTKVIEMKEEGSWNGMFWRFSPASDPKVDVIISRDTDCRLDEREKFAVEEWLASGKSFHIMRDHPFHKTEILGGMWGVRGDILKDMDYLIEKYHKGDFWQVDQNFLREHIYPMVKEDCYVHDEFFEINPFPHPRIGKNFVGQAFNAENEPLHPEHGKMLT